MPGLRGHHVQQLCVGIKLGRLRSGRHSDACDACPTNPNPDCETDDDVPGANTAHSMARQWNELLLSSIRGDFARPTVHARNLWHSSMLMWDAWAVMDSASCPGHSWDKILAVLWPVMTDSLLPEMLSAHATRPSHLECIACCDIALPMSPQATTLLQGYDEHMATLGYDVSFTSTDYSTATPVPWATIWPTKSSPSAIKTNPTSRTIMPTRSTSP